MQAAGACENSVEQIYAKDVIRTWSRKDDISITREYWSLVNNCPPTAVMIVQYKERIIGSGTGIVFSYKLLASRSKAMANVQNGLSGQTGCASGAFGAHRAKVKHRNIRTLF